MKKSSSCLLNAIFLWSSFWKWSLETRKHSFIESIITPSKSKNNGINISSFPPNPLAKFHYCWFVKYEDLVGPEGNGDRETQIKTLEGIANYLMIDISPEEIKPVADICYQSSPPVCLKARSTKEQKLVHGKSFLTKSIKGFSKRSSEMNWSNLVMKKMIIGKEFYFSERLWRGQAVVLGALAQMPDLEDYLDLSRDLGNPPSKTCD